ncbi:TPA: LOW QUALITY PROTEIN: hypothetical protein N0F65_004251 [Lagenidium giganteum]|uniref:Expansin-like EG45 domain-containing protein n=1 Tax=Lagenidium giganteum TaxID=4803 RepID=A0AAV2ZH20_9STRA|nr:TPA: LOW QUALITY PROTEIN: hypothetical protein N0F65_004251 [Lagenidium giganteum]
MAHAIPGVLPACPQSPIFPVSLTSPSNTMLRSTTHFGLALLATAVAGTTAEQFTGDGTAYTLGQPSSGNCNFMAWPSAAVENYAAMNNEQWEDSHACGRCVQVSCDDSRCTSTQSAVVYIMDRCPECKKGDLDLSPSVFKTITGSDPSRLKVKWSFVDCPSPGNMKMCLKAGSNPHWTAVQPTNMATGVKSVSINGKVGDMVPSAYYYKVENSGGIDLSKLQVSITSITGEVVNQSFTFGGVGNSGDLPGTAGPAQGSTIQTQSTTTSFAAEGTDDAANAASSGGNAAVVVALVAVGCVGAAVGFRAYRKRQDEKDQSIALEASAADLTARNAYSLGPKANIAILTPTDATAAAPARRSGPLTAAAAGLLPHGAVQTKDGDVVIPGTRRADGSMRKAVRIRKGYVPQEEVPRYKPIGQRRREEEAKRLEESRAAKGDAAAVQLAGSMGKMTIDSKGSARSDQQEDAPHNKDDSKQMIATGDEIQTRTQQTQAAASGPSPAELKQELTKLNKTLKEIAKIEQKHQSEGAELSSHEKRKLGHKSDVQERRASVVAQLNGADVRQTTVQPAKTTRRVIEM